MKDVNYGAEEVRDLLRAYPNLVGGSRAQSALVIGVIAELEEALERLPEREYRVVEACGPHGLSVRETALVLGRSKSAVGVQLQRAREWMVEYLNADREYRRHRWRRLRELDWRDRVMSSLDEDLESALLVARKRRGRPPRIDPATERYIGDLYQRGLTLAEVAERLNREAVSAVGRGWTASALRRPLARQGVSLRPRGRRRRRGPAA